MAHGKVFLTSNRIALLALGLSVVSSGFAVYQWLSSARDEHIRAAIEASNGYIDQWVNISLLQGQFEKGFADRTSLSPAEKQLDRLEYIALLANEGLANPDYLSQRVICDIIHNADSESLPQAANFKSHHPAACLADAKADANVTSSSENK
jgi:hypothetical protein